MGSLTPEMIQKILKRYSELLSYSKVAKEFGIDARTVKQYVGNMRPSKQQNVTLGVHENLKQPNRALKAN
jgi:DNA-directed RNA polymerase specialized sigma24 family protein